MCKQGAATPVCPNGDLQHLQLSRGACLPTWHNTSASRRRRITYVAKARPLMSISLNKTPHHSLLQQPPSPPCRCTSNQRCPSGDEHAPCGHTPPPPSLHPAPIPPPASHRRCAKQTSKPPGPCLCCAPGPGGSTAATCCCAPPPSAHAAPPGSGCGPHTPQSSCFWDRSPGPAGTWAGRGDR